MASCHKPIGCSVLADTTGSCEGLDRSQNDNHEVDAGLEGRNDSDVHLRGQRQEPFNRDGCLYEEQASQEEIYLEETEEQLRMIVESGDPSPLRSEGPDQQREHAAEELIIGDSDDPPLSEETVKQILRMAIIFRDLERNTEAEQ
jgi:hypothetical protein